MGKDTRDVRIRSFREGDEQVLCRLFNDYVSDFFGPIRLSPHAWRKQFRRRSWTGPSLTEDRDCCRIAETSNRALGYAITDYQPMNFDGGAVLQELCTTREDGAEDLVHALIADAENRALERGKFYLAVYLSPEDGGTAAVAEARGYESQVDEGGVFMGAVTNLAGLLSEMRPALCSRLAADSLSEWRGTINVVSGQQSACLELRPPRVNVGLTVKSADIELAVRSEALPLLLFGREPVGELYVQDMISVSAGDVAEALHLLDVLFPRLPLFLPRAQWW